MYLKFKAVLEQMPEELERCRELGVLNTICPEMVRCAAEIVEQMLAEEK